jgi:colanic acid/amylovoran biosynthesis protein
MKRFYLAGQNNFGNRGCEALVRSTIHLLKSEFGEVEVLVPSYRPDLDILQWPTAENEGCRFVRAMPYPLALKVWGKLNKLHPIFKSHYIPNFSIPADIENDIKSCDALLVIGGDNITLDYGVESLIWHIRFAQHAQRANKKVMVWGASIGPFSTEPAIEKFVATFLKTCSYVTIRETISENYLQSIGINTNTALVADGAFVMKPEPIETENYWPTANDAQILGFNISPLIQKFRPANEPRKVLQEEVAAFIRHTLDNSNTSIVLIPHVDPLDGQVENSDSYYMRDIREMCSGYKGRLSIAPNNLNAAQLKYVLSKCTYFIGARTHATIAALSGLVPTISIAYSIKARGLNRDLFGNEDCVLETPKVNTESLIRSYKYLVNNREAIVAELAKKIPEWQKKTLISANLLGAAINSK